MSLPSYSTLTFNLQTLFSYGYQIGKYFVSTCNKTKGNHIEFKASLAHDIEESNAVSQLEVKENFFKMSGVTQWCSNNTVSKEIAFQDLLIPGLKIGGIFQYNLDSGVQGWNALGQFKFTNVTIDSSIEGGGEEDKLYLNAGIVTGFRGFITAVQCKVDTGEGAMKSSSFTGGYLSPDFSYLLISVDSNATVCCNYYQQMTPNLELGLVSKPNGEGGPTMDIAAKYAIQPDRLTFRGKINNKSEVGLGCEVQVVKGCSLLFSTAFDLKEFNSGNQKFGIGLDFK